MKKIFLYAIVAVFFAANCWATVLFQTNFDTVSDWNCRITPVPSGFSGYETSLGSCPTNGSGLYAAMIKSPGRGGSGKAYYSYLSSRETANYNILDWSFSSHPNEIYHRFYIYVPTAIATSGTLGYQKLWRYRMSDGSSIYLDFIGSSIQGSTLRLIQSVRGVSESLGLSFSELTRDNWHAVEIRIKLNTGANSIVQLWLDDVEQASISDVNLTDDPALVFDHSSGPLDAGVGFGNQASTGEYQEAWTAILFDDIVISTQRIYASGNPPSVTISSPTCSTNVESSPVAFAGAASDSDGTIASVHWYNDTDATDGVCTGTTSWSCSVTVTSGLNNIRIVATDNDGLTGSTSACPITLTDALPVVTLSATDDTATEDGPTSGTLRFTRTGSSGDLNVYFALTGSASYDDYSEDLSGGYVTIANGNTYVEQTITATQNDDTEDETIVISLSSNENYTIGSPNVAVVNIIDATPKDIILGEVWGENSSSDHTGTCEDTFIAQGGSATTNFSEYTDIRQYWSNGGEYDNASILRFDLSSANATINNAYLQLYLFYGLIGTEADVSIHRISGVTPVISEATGTVYATGSAWTDDDFGLSDIETAENTIAVGLSPGWVTFTITQMAQWAITNNSGILYIYLKNGTGTTETGRYFVSNDSSSDSLRPKLIIQQTNRISGGGSGSITSAGTGSITAP